MTLILTALCKNGICICADRRFQIKHNNGSVENRDDYHKIYKFTNNSLIIYNHGVNKFNDKYWDTYCSDYEKSNRWLGKNLKQIVDDFKDFIEKHVLLQLRFNIQDLATLTGVNASGFVLCGKTELDNKYELYDLFWDPSFKPFIWNTTGLVGSGDGYKTCLHNYLLSLGRNARVNSIEFWGSLNIDEAKKELIKLFSLAVNKKVHSGVDNFSDQFDIEYISD